MKYFIFLSVVLTGCSSMNEPQYNFGLDEIKFEKLPKYNKCDYQKCNYFTATMPPETVRANSR